MTSTVRIKRRTQAERSEETREKLCIATLDALNELGYGHFTTEDVARRAQVSRGALTHQFPSRNDLLIAAFDHLVTQWERDWPFSSPNGIPSMDADELMDVLWNKLFRPGHYMASLEMMLASRIDEELGEGIRKVMQRWSELRDDVIARILGLSPESPETRAFIQLNLCVMRGIAVHHSFDPDPDAQERLLQAWKQTLRSVAPRPGPAVAARDAAAKPKVCH